MKLLLTLSLLSFALLSAGCRSGGPASLPAEPPQRSSGKRIAPPMGAVIVTANALNVRQRPDPKSERMRTVRRGDRLILIDVKGEWSKVQLSDSEVGWVASRFVRDERIRLNPKCPADKVFSFAEPPKPRFSEAGPHGLVTIEADVDASGVVRSSKIVSNTTGSSEMGRVAQKELEASRFNPPIRNCVAVGFIYTYKRAF